MGFTGKSDVMDLKIKTKLSFAAPRLYILGMCFLIIVPYLYPQSYFPYTKVLSIPEHLLAVSAIILFVLIAYSSSWAIKPRKMEKLNGVEIVIPKLLFQLSVFVVAISLVINVLIVVNAILSFEGNFYSAKNSIDDFKGINIISQFYLFFIPIVLYHSVKKGLKRGKQVVIFLGGVLLVRAGLMGERVAFLEYFIPVIVTLAYINQTKISYFKVLKYFLIFLAFFVVLELTRQFYVQYVIRGDGDVTVGFAFSWALERFFAYYADTQNKLYFAIENHLSYSTTHYLYPLKRVAYRIFDYQSTAESIYYGKYHWRDFTNPGGFSMFYTDFGFFGVIPLFLLIFSFFRFWNVLISKQAIYALAIYPNLVIVILEMPRFVFFYQTRYVYPLLVFGFVYLFSYLMIGRFSRKRS